MTGTVKWFDVVKGHGFIVPDEPLEDERDVFVHYSGIQGEGFKTLNEGERVLFELKQNGNKGMMAVDVVVLTR